MVKIFSKFAILLMFSSLLSGCLGGEDDDAGIILDVSLSTSEGTILHSYVDGDLVSVSDVSVEFDFSNSSSDSELILFGINANDSRDSIEVDAKESQTIVMNFSQHGVYEVAVYAIDADDNYREESVIVKLNYRIDWSEYETNNPKVLPFDPRPANDGQHATMIEVSSLVENPDLITEFGNGNSVYITWNIIDENNDTCQRYSEQVANGETITWETIHFNTYLLHELVVDNDESEDAINLAHSIQITY